MNVPTEIVEAMVHWVIADAEMRGETPINGQQLAERVRAMTPEQVREARTFDAAWKSRPENL